MEFIPRVQKSVLQKTVFTSAPAKPVVLTAELNVLERRIPKEVFVQESVVQEDKLEQLAKRVTALEHTNTDLLEQMAILKHQVSTLLCYNRTPVCPTSDDEPINESVNEPTEPIENGKDVDVVDDGAVQAPDTLAQNECKEYNTMTHAELLVVASNLGIAPCQNVKKMIKAIRKAEAAKI
jgi:hypothetical protein